MADVKVADPTEERITLGEAARLLQTGYLEAWGLARSGLLGARKTGGRWTVSVAAIEALRGLRDA